jgi:hypothetical protein
MWIPCFYKLFNSNSGHWFPPFLAINRQNATMPHQVNIHRLMTTLQGYTGTQDKVDPRSEIRRTLAQHDFCLGWLEQICYSSG